MYSGAKYVQWCSINISAMQYQPMNIHISSSNQQEEEEEAPV